MVFDAAGQGFNILAVAFGVALVVAIDEVFNFFAFNHFSVDVQTAVFHFDFVAGEADNAFDEIGFVVLRKFENDNIAALRFVCPNATFYQRQAERQGMFGIAVSIF